jgi:hypothetical protein
MLYELVNADNKVLLRISPKFSRAWLENWDQQTYIRAGRSDSAGENAVRSAGRAAVLALAVAI